MPVLKENIVNGLVSAVMYTVEVNGKPEVVSFNNHDEAGKALDCADRRPDNTVVVCSYKDYNFYIDDLDLFEHTYDWRTVLGVRRLRRMKKRA